MAQVLMPEVAPWRECGHLDVSRRVRRAKAPGDENETVDNVGRVDDMG